MAQTKIKSEQFNLTTSGPVTSGSGGFTYTTDASISATKVTTFTIAGGGNIQFN